MLVVLYVVVGRNFGLTIIVFTILIKVATLPLIIKTVRTNQKMSKLQPRIAEINKKYAKEPQKKSQETMALYKQVGFSPLGCFGPMLIQFLVFIGLYQAIIQTVQGTPDAVVNLSEKLYSWVPLAHSAVPLNNHFLGMDLSALTNSIKPAFLMPVLPILVGVTTWISQKTTTLPATSPQQAQQNQLMLWMMPVMLAWLSLTFPAGLALYWVVGNVVQVALQAPMTGVKSIFSLKPTMPADVAPAPAVIEGKAEAPTEETKKDATSARDDRKERGRGDRNRAQRNGRKTRNS